MLFPRIFPALVLFSVLLNSCSQQQEARGTSQPGVTTEPVASGLEVADSVAAKQRTRISRGDTVSLHYRELAKFLPARVAGFERGGEPRGESVNLGGVSYSTCEQYYRKGHLRLKVQLVDYNGAPALYAGATALMSSGISQESDEQLMQGCDIGVPRVRGYETLQKKESRAAVALGVGDRFFVSVESSGQHDTRLVKKVARKLDLKRLMAL